MVHPTPVTSVLLLGLAAAVTAYGAEPATKPAAGDAPLVLGEAKLPAGWPAPGPVGTVVVKHYPPSRQAINTGDDERRMFSPLFDHIQKHAIPMTAPVQITWSAPTTGPSRPVAMAFLYRSPAVGQTGVDGDVKVVDVPAQTVVSVGLRGNYDRDQLADGLAKLRAFLADHPKQFRVVGPPRCLGYNSPMVPPAAKYGEVQLPVVAGK